MTDHDRPVLAWRLAVLMAERQIRTTRALRRRLSQHGINLSEAQLGRIVKGLPRQLSTDLLAGLCGVLQVAPGELLTIPGFRTPSTVASQHNITPASQQAPAGAGAEPPAGTTPKVLPRSSTGRPQATAIPRPKY